MHLFNNYFQFIRKFQLHLSHLSHDLVLQ